MINNNEKILLLDKRILDLTEIYLSLLDYIKKIEGGMEDPDMTISECNEVLPKIMAKKDALVAEKQRLLGSIAVV